jgi:hypothetical protein
MAREKGARRPNRHSAICCPSCIEISGESVFPIFYRLFVVSIPSFIHRSIYDISTRTEVQDPVLSIPYFNSEFSQFFFRMICSDLTESLCLAEGALKECKTISTCSELHEARTQVFSFCSRMRTEIELIVAELDFSLLKNRNLRGSVNKGPNRKGFKLESIDDFTERIKTKKKETKIVPVKKVSPVPKKPVMVSTQALSSRKEPSKPQSIISATPNITLKKARVLKSFVRTEDILVDL